MKCHISDGSIYWGEWLVGETNKVTVAPGEQLTVKSPACYHLLAPMPGGDAVFAGVGCVIGLERKSGSDFVSSYTSGHLAEQLAIMLECFDDVVLVVESHRFPALCVDAGLDYAVVCQDLLTYQAAGVRILLTTSIWETGRLVDSLFTYYQREVHHALDRKQPTNNALYRRILSSVPGWGSATVRAALLVLHTPDAVLAASRGDLLSIKGVTRRQVDNLFAALGRR